MHVDLRGEGEYRSESDVHEPQNLSVLIKPYLLSATVDEDEVCLFVCCWQYQALLETTTCSSSTKDQRLLRVVWCDLKDAFAY